MLNSGCPFFITCLGWLRTEAADPAYWVTISSSAKQSSGGGPQVHALARTIVTGRLLMIRPTYPLTTRRTLLTTKRPHMR